jgi:hypothetical protein
MKAKPKLNVLNRKTIPSVTHTQHIAIKGFAQGTDGDVFARLAFKHNGNSQLVLFNMRALYNRTASEFDNLNQAGGRVYSFAARKELEIRLQANIPSKITRRVATRIGWVGGKFAFPDECLPATPPRMDISLTDLPGHFASKYSVRGDLQGALKLKEFAMGNSRMLLALSLAFTGPLGSLLGWQPIAIQLFGEPGTGKSALGTVVSSIWGWNIDKSIAYARGFGETWNSTGNALEKVALAHNHNFLFLDETRALVDYTNSRTASILDSLMRLDQGITKTRLGDHNRSTWWTPIFSTSNRSLDQLAKDAGGFVDDAYRDRLIDVPLAENCSSVFENLHNFPDLSTFVRNLKELAAENHGVSGREFVRKLASKNAKESKFLKKFVKNRAHEYRQAILEFPEAVDRIRLSEKFSNIYTAGALARWFKILPFERKIILDAVVQCQRSHLAYVGKAQIDAITLLSQYVAKHSTEFQLIAKAGLILPETYKDGPGFILTAGGRRELLMFHRDLLNLFQNEKYCRIACSQLLAGGVLNCDSQASDGQRYVVKRTLGKQKSGKKVRTFVVSILLDELEKLANEKFDF